MPKRVPIWKLKVLFVYGNLHPQTRVSSLKDLSVCFKKSAIIFGSTSF